MANFLSTQSQPAMAPGQPTGPQIVYTPEQIAQMNAIAAQSQTATATPNVTTPGGEATTATVGGADSAAPGNDANQIQGWASKFLGRNFSDADIAALAGQPLDLVMHNIANSDEAQAYAARNQTAAAAGPAAQSSAGQTTSTGGFDFGPLLQPWTVPFTYQDFQGPTYTAPTLNDLYTKDPGYQARLEAGRQTMEKGAAARGTLLTGGTIRDENQAAQDYASNEWGNFNQQQLANFGTLYNSQLGDWTTNYNKALQGYQQAYNIFSNNQANQFNRLASVSGIGQTAAGQLGSSGLGYANAFTNTTQGNASNLGDLYTQQANANAAGTVGSSNAWGSAIGNATNLGSLYASSYGQSK